MIEELLASGVIDQKAYQNYHLFQVNELGRKWLYQMMDGTYMDEPAEQDFSGVAFAFYDGRRALIRDIRRMILFVEQKLKEIQT